MRLVIVLRHVDIPIERSRRLQKSRGRILKPMLHKGLRKWRSEADVIDNVRDIGHVCREVVIARLGLDVKVPGSAIDEEETGELTPWMFLVDPRVLYPMSVGGEVAGVGFVFGGANGPVGGDCRV